MQLNVCLKKLTAIYLVVSAQKQHSPTGWHL